MMPFSRSAVILKEHRRLGGARARQRRHHHAVGKIVASEPDRLEQRSTGVFHAAVAGAMSVVVSGMGSSCGRNEWFKILVDPSGDAPSLSGAGETVRLFLPNAP
jgi:hypothetical protein